MNFRDSLLVDRTQICKLKNSAGLSFSIYENGSIHTIEQDSIQLNLFAGSPLEASCANIYLRIRGEKIVAIPLLGPKSPSLPFFENNFFGVKGQFNDISYSCRLLLAEEDSSWLWDVHLLNTGASSVEIDLLYVQDVGLTHLDGGEKNEFYISQYIDYTELDSEARGKIVCCRQNEPVLGRTPWLALGALGWTESFSTDGIQFFGSQYRETAVPRCLSASGLPGLMQKESAVVVLQQRPFVLESEQSHSLGFFGVYSDNHKSPTVLKDLDFVNSRIENFSVDHHQTWPEQPVSQEFPQSLFSLSPLFVSDDLTEEDLVGLFGKEQRHLEVQDDELLSFFYGENRHVVLRRKELLAERPHGHIMKSGTELVPDDSAMSSTSYMFGVFNSHVSQGNVNFNRFLTVNTNPFNLIRHSGQRIFVKLDGEYQQLGVPSAFEIDLHSCRWIYKQADLLFEIKAWARPDCPEVMLHIHVIEGPELGWLISNQLESEHQWSLNASTRDGKSEYLDFVPLNDSQLAQLYPSGSFSIQLERSDRVKRTGGDELLFEDGKSRGLFFAVIELDPTKDFVLRFCGNLPEKKSSENSEFDSDENETFWLDSRKSVLARQEISSGLRVCSPMETGRNDIDEIFEILPWFAQNAQIHYLTPHGLEQYGGAAWGTRDVCQGPMEMLLSLGHYSQAREVLCRIFSNQNSDGNWPQWWMFDCYNRIRCPEAHGDVIFWPILALSEYIAASGDYDFLKKQLPFYGDNESCDTGRATVLEHVLRCYEHIELKRFLNDSSLVNYSEGDWNDSMQPANPKLRDRLISSWTVELSYQAFKKFSKVCRGSGRNSLAEKIQSRCDSIRADFNNFLMKDGVVAGFGYLKDQQTVDLLLHPSDSVMGIRYRLLPMIRGIISEIFSPEQALHHADLIEQYLKGPDGARLMDNPPRYHGGVQQFFKRAESSPFFGREIGLMYTHAHLRYAEAMAKLGRPEAFVKALRQIIPIRIQDVIPQATLRQSNCYYSSSDANISDRYEVDKCYGDIQSGKVTLNGGWRIYSSGPGIVVRLIISNLLGIRHEYGKTTFDPVLPAEFNGLTATVEYGGRNVTIVYVVTGNNKGISEIAINGTRHPFERELNPYRSGGVMINDSALWAALNQEANKIVITL